MSTTRFSCYRCGGSGLAANGLVCTACNGSGFTVPHESTGDQIRDWESRNWLSIVLGFLVVMGAWIFGLGRWAFGRSGK